MPELSPAAQAVDRAIADRIQLLGEIAPSRQIAAAALRAVANQVICSVPPPCADVDEFAKGLLAAHVKYKREILAIAAELEGQS